MSKTDTCLKCGQVGHTSSSCKRVQCVACENFRMTVRAALQKCAKKSSAWSPSPTFWRECGQAKPAAEGAESKRRAALKNMGSITA